MLRTVTCHVIQMMRKRKDWKACYFPHYVVNATEKWYFQLPLSYIKTTANLLCLQCAIIFHDSLLHSCIFQFSDHWKATQTPVAIYSKKAGF